MEKTSKNISSLWVVLLFNMVFADIFSIIIEITEGGFLEIPGDPKI